jgi:hypothetical protein
MVKKKIAYSLETIHYMMKIGINFGETDRSNECDTSSLAKVALLSAIKGVKFTLKIHTFSILKSIIFLL